MWKVSIRRGDCESNIAILQENWEKLIGGKQNSYCQKTKFITIHILGKTVQSIWLSSKKKKKMLIIQPIPVILNTMWNLIAHFYAAKVGNGNYQGVHGVFFGTMRPSEERILIINDALFLLKSIHKRK